MNKTIILMLLTGSIMGSQVHANNPASVEWVKSQIANIPPYTAGPGITITNNVISSSTQSTTYTLFQHAQGGIIYYLDSTGQHGLVVADSDLLSTDLWQGTILSNVGAYLTGLYLGGNATTAGQQNTSIIVSVLGDDTNAAYACSKIFTSNGYSDWFLPAIQELALIYIEKNSIGTTFQTSGSTTSYWSSTEAGTTTAWSEDFKDASVTNSSAKGTRYNVRCIRSF